MKAEQFVEHLEALAPTIAELKEAGLNENEAIAERESYHCYKRLRPLAVSNDSNELVNLLSNWNTGKIEIGMVQLFDEPIQMEEGLQIGVVEADPLVITSNGELFVYEKGSQHILWKVAQNPDYFLDALLEAASFLAKTGIGTIDFEDIEIAKKVVRTCTKLVGGKDYEPFYLMLLGGD